MLEQATIYTPESPTQDIHRTTDAAQVNGLVYLNSGQVADFSGFLDNSLNVCLLRGDSGILFAWRGPGIYETHVFFDQHDDAHEVCTAFLDEMRSEYGARIFWAAIPVTDDYRHVRIFARSMGWRQDGFAELPHGRCELFIDDGGAACRQ